MLISTIFKSPIGPLQLVADESALVRLNFHRDSTYIDGAANRSPVLRTAVSQLTEYFRGRRTRFDLPLRPIGTEFQLRVWHGLRTIPYGVCWSYGQLAAAVGFPKAARAVGGANNRNPLAIIVPCHRVVGHDGKLVGFGGGLPTKKALLELEGATMPNANPAKANTEQMIMFAKDLCPQPKTMAPLLI
jgi:methylated-DNA-[protein]-cysteine S-methyltransferase